MLKCFQILTTICQILMVLSLFRCDSTELIEELRFYRERIDFDGNGNAIV